MLIPSIAAWPTWLVLASFAAVFLLLMFGSRRLLARIKDDERRSEVAGLAGSMNGPTGATLAFLVGFAVSITWGTMSAAQSAVERLAAQAQQTALLTGSALEPSAAATINADIQAYLRAIIDRDSAVLANEEVTEMPSFTELEKLQTDVRSLQVAAQGGPNEATLRTVQTNVVTMAGIQAELNGVARRGLPPVVIQLLIMVGGLSACTVGMLAVDIRRPYLIVGWAFVIAMGISVVMGLYNPFVGSVSITFDPLNDAVQRLSPPR